MKVRNHEISKNRIISLFRY